MTREQAIRLLATKRAQPSTDWQMAEVYTMAIKALEQEPWWISSGKKPPEKGSYLVWMPFAPPECRVAVAEYCGGYWDIKTPISAWMPLPEAYREEGEQE